MTMRASRRLKLSVAAGLLAVGCKHRTPQAEVQAAPSGLAPLDFSDPAFDDPSFIGKTREGLASCAAVSLCTALVKGTKGKVKTEGFASKCGLSAAAGATAAICIQSVKLALRPLFKATGDYPEPKDSERAEKTYKAVVGASESVFLNCLADAGITKPAKGFLWYVLAKNCGGPMLKSLQYTADTTVKAFDAFVTGPQTKSVSIPGCKATQQWGVHKNDVGLGEAISAVYWVTRSVEGCQRSVDTMTEPTSKSDDSWVGTTVKGYPDGKLTSLQYTLRCGAGSGNFKSPCANFCFANVAGKRACQANQSDQTGKALYDGQAALEKCVAACAPPAAPDLVASEKATEEFLDDAETAAPEAAPAPAPDATPGGCARILANDVAFVFDPYLDRTACLATKLATFTDILPRVAADVDRAVAACQDDAELSAKAARAQTKVSAIRDADAGRIALTALCDVLSDAPAEEP